MHPKTNIVRIFKIGNVYIFFPLKLLGTPRKRKCNVMKNLQCKIPVNFPSQEYLIRNASLEPLAYRCIKSWDLYIYIYIHVRSSVDTQSGVSIIAPLHATLS